MKEWIIVLSVLILTFVPSFMFGKFLENTGNELIDILDDMSKDFEYAKQVDSEKSNKLRETFLQTEGKWIMIVDHEVLDEIEDSLEECIAFYDENDKTEFEVSSGKLKNHISDLAKREKVIIGNIF